MPSQKNKGINPSVLVLCNPVRSKYLRNHARVAQMVEQLICNQLVGGSIPFSGSAGRNSIFRSGDCSCQKGNWTPSGQVVKWPTTTDCKSVLFGVRWFESILAHEPGLCRQFKKMEIGFPERSLFENKFDGSGVLTYVQTYKFSVFLCGSSSVGRATAFQAVGRGFEPRLPLLHVTVLAMACPICRSFSEAGRRWVVLPKL